MCATPDRQHLLKNKTLRSTDTQGNRFAQGIIFVLASKTVSRTGLRFQPTVSVKKTCSVHWRQTFLSIEKQCFQSRHRVCRIFAYCACLNLSHGYEIGVMRSRTNIMLTTVLQSLREADISLVINSFWFGLSRV